MTLDLAKSPPPRLARPIVQRTRGHSHGAITRLVSPSDVGELIKPFVFLDYFDIDPKAHAGDRFSSAFRHRNAYAPSRGADLV